MQKVSVLLLCELIRIFEMLIITVQLQPHQFKTGEAQNAGCKLFAYAASHPLAHAKPSCNA